MLKIIYAAAGIIGLNLLEKQELGMYQLCCRHIVQTLVIQVKPVKWSMKVILTFF